jgi:methylated-DNA-[protein]-cysteine S-methyltransferase
MKPSRSTASGTIATPPEAGASMRRRVVDTPLGPMCLQAEGGALTGAWFLDQPDCPPEAAAQASAESQSPAHAPAAGESSLESQSSTGSRAAIESQSPAQAAAESRPGSGSPPPSLFTGRPAAATSAAKSKAAARVMAAQTAASGMNADPILDQAARELDEYFAGRRRDFSLAMAPRGTPFQKRVWDALRDIPFGGLESYGALSKRCAQAAAVRAVAQAVGRNPISIFIPCHRIVGSNSALTGFGGGLPRKQSLLALEGHTYATPSPGARLKDRDSRQQSLW